MSTTNGVFSHFAFHFKCCQPFFSFLKQPADWSARKWIDLPIEEWDCGKGRKRERTGEMTPSVCVVEGRERGFPGKLATVATSRPLTQWPDGWEPCQTVARHCWLVKWEEGERERVCCSIPASWLESMSLTYWPTVCVFAQLWTLQLPK